MWHNQKIQNVTKPKNSNCKTTQNLKFGQYMYTKKCERKKREKMIIVTKLKKNTNYDKTQKKLKLWLHKKIVTT